MRDRTQRADRRHAFREPGEAVTIRDVDWERLDRRAQAYPMLRPAPVAIPTVAI
jgi:hypothetical protein